MLTGLKKVEEVARNMGVEPELVMMILDKGKMAYCDRCHYPTETERLNKVPNDLTLCDECEADAID